ELITHKKVVTTLAKARALRTYIEPLITKGKENTTHQRRIVFSYLQNKEATAELFSTVADKVGGRPGGYTRVIKRGIRQGDNGEMALIELVDFNEIYGKGKGESKEGAKRTRRGRGGKKGATGKADEGTEEVATAEEGEKEEKETSKPKKKAAK